MAGKKAQKIIKNDIFQTLSRLREKYPDADDISRIDADGERVKALLTKKQYFTEKGTQELLALCRSQIKMARKKLATDKTLIGDEKAQRELWFIAESREWFVKMVSEDVDSELASIEQELEAELEE